MLSFFSTFEAVDKLAVYLLLLCEQRVSFVQL